MNQKQFENFLDVSEIQDIISQDSQQNLSEIRDSLNVLDSQFLNEDSIEQMIMENICKSSLMKKLISIKRFIEDPQTNNSIISYLKQKYVNLVKFFLCHSSVTIKDYQLLFQIFHVYLKHQSKAEFKESFINNVKQFIQSIKSKIKIDQIQSLKLKVLFQMLRIKQIHNDEKQFVISFALEKANKSLIFHIQNFIEDLSKKVNINVKISLKEYISYQSKFNTNNPSKQSQQVKNTPTNSQLKSNLNQSELEQDNSLLEMIQYLEMNKNDNQYSKQILKKIQAKSLMDFVKCSDNKELVLLLLKASLTYKQLLKKGISYSLYILTVQDFISNFKKMLTQYHPKPILNSIMKIIKDEVSRNLQNSDFILSKLGLI